MGRGEAASELEALACHPVSVDPDGFNPGAVLPYGCSMEHIQLAMNSFLDFLGFVNQQLYSKGIGRLESLLMPANFSSIVGEFVAASVPEFCTSLVKNRYHNGHPDLNPKGIYPNDAIRHAPKGIEIKASRYLRGWQGHNPEDVWLMVFVFDSNRPIDPSKQIIPKPFRFIKVVGAQLTKDDWKYSGRSETSRRTITASVTSSGFDKMTANWIYRDPGLL